jgi:hypothetical protein
MKTVPLQEYIICNVNELCMFATNYQLALFSIWTANRPIDFLKSFLLDFFINSVRVRVSVAVRGWSRGMVCVSYIAIQHIFHLPKITSDQFFGWKIVLTQIIMGVHIAFFER